MDLKGQRQTVLNMIDTGRSPQLRRTLVTSVSRGSVLSTGRDESGSLLPEGWYLYLKFNHYKTMIEAMVSQMSKSGSDHVSSHRINSKVVL